VPKIMQISAVVLKTRAIEGSSFAKNWVDFITRWCHFVFKIWPT